MTPEGAHLVVDNKDEQRFEITVDGHRAELVYGRDADRLELIHTEVPDALEGRGLGGALVRAALGTAIEENLVVVPRCPFARSWLQKHPDEAGRASIDWRVA